MDLMQDLSWVQWLGLGIMLFGFLRLLKYIDDKVEEITIIGTIQINQAG